MKKINMKMKMKMKVQYKMGAETFMFIMAHPFYMGDINELK